MNLLTEQQQTQGNEQSPANQNHNSEHTVTRSGRVCKPPNRFKDIIIYYFTIYYYRSLGIVRRERIFV